MRIGLPVVASGFVCLAVACDPGPVGSRSEFSQPLPEPALHRATNPPDPSGLLARLLSSVRTAQFQIIGTEEALRAQGQIGAQTYHLDGALTTGGPALELRPWNGPLTAGPEPDIDGRGDFVMFGATIYERANTFIEWHTSDLADPRWGVFADINPATWKSSPNMQILGQASLDGSATWVLQMTNRFGRQFKAWVRERDGYPMRYTASWLNAKGLTYYTNAIYTRFNTVLEITVPDMLNRGVANLGAPVTLPFGSVRIPNVDFDCTGTASRRPAPHEKFVLVTLEFVDAGPGQIFTSPDAWRLYGDGADAAVPIDIGGPSLLQSRTLKPGDRVRVSWCSRSPRTRTSSSRSATWLGRPRS